MIELLKASAGSGKTWNLAKTYIGLLLQNEDRNAYRHILAVTFTNKATDEMKSRILKELHLLSVHPEASDICAEFVPRSKLWKIGGSRDVSTIFSMTTAPFP